MATVTHSLWYWTRAGKTDHLAEQVRGGIARGMSVLVATSSGDVDGAAWLAEYERTLTRIPRPTPIAEGDYLRWTLQCEDGERWAEGVAREVHADGRVMTMTVERTHNWPAAERCKANGQLICPEVGDPSHRDWSSIRRVSRPAEAPIGVGDLVRYDGQQVDRNNRITGRINQWLEGVVTSFVRGDAVIRVDRHSEGSRFASEVTIPPICLRRVARPTSDALAASAVDDQIRRNIEQAKPLIEGLARAECYARWRENRIAVERGAVPAHVMTADQIATAKRLYAEHDGFVLSVILRKALAKRAAAQANPIRVDLELAPWE